MAVVRSRTAVPAHGFHPAYVGSILQTTAMGRQTLSVVFGGLAYLYYEEDRADRRIVAASGAVALASPASKRSNARSQYCKSV
jgi:hypothetical protein